MEAIRLFRMAQLDRPCLTCMQKGIKAVRLPGIPSVWPRAECPLFCS